MARQRSPIRLKSSTTSAGSINYAADYVMDALADSVGAIDEDIVVTTTINLKMQAEAEHPLTDELNAKGLKFGVEQGALVALDPTGAVKAMVGDATMPTASSIARSRQAPAWLVVQALRLSGGAGEGTYSRHRA